jgi:hypothetical protein
MKNFEEKGHTDRMLLLEYMLYANVKFVMCRRLKTTNIKTRSREDIV